MTTKRQIVAVISTALDAALDGDFTTDGLANVVTDAVLAQFTVQTKPPRGPMQGDMGPQHPNYRCDDCACTIPCASGTCRYPADVLSTHSPESFHVNGYLTCAGCRGVPWSVEHVMELQNEANR